jgi:dolichol-phosphate mannosyltransferase
MEKNNINYEFLFVNDGSRDRTLEILEEIVKLNKNIRVVNFSRNFGHQAAVTAGIDRAKGDAMVIIDADLQDPPELIPDMIKLWQDGYDVVYAKRKKRKGEKWFKLVTAKYFYRFLSIMSDVDIPEDTGDFRLIDRKVAEVLRNLPEKNRFLRGLISWVGFKQIPIEYERQERFAGKTKYPLKKMLKLAADGIFSFSSKPVKLPMYAGIFTIAVSVIFFIIGIVNLIAGADAVNIWGSLIFSSVNFIGGIILLSNGILGEYTSRVYDEARQRPNYIVEREIKNDEK